MLNLYKLQKYKTKYNNLFNMIGGTYNYDIHGLIIAHGEYLHGSDLCVIPENISIITFAKREGIQTMNFSSGIGKFLCKNEDRPEIMENKKSHGGQIYKPLSVIEDLTLDFRIIFDNKKKIKEYFYSGIITDKNIKNWQPEKIKDGWEIDAISANDSSIIDNDILLDQIKNNKATYLLSDILKKIHNAYNNKTCIFILYACRGKDGYASLTELPEPDTMLKKKKETFERQDSLKFYRIPSDIISEFNIMDKLDYIQQHGDGDKELIPKIIEIRNKIETTYKISMKDFTYIKELYDKYK